MKKLTLLLSAAFVLVSMPAFAQNTFEKAKDTNAAGKSATQSQSATESRNINNSAWDGSGNGSGTPEGKNGTIDLIGGNNPDERMEDKPSTFDKPESEDATPWKDLLTSIVSTIMGAMAMLATAALVSYFATTHNYRVNSEDWATHIQKIARAIAIAAVAVLAVAMALATTLMIKYGQHLLGGLWLGCATLGMASGIAMIVGTSKLADESCYYINYKKICAILMTTTLAVAAIGVGGGGYLAYKSYKQLNQQGAQK